MGSNGVVVSGDHASDDFMDAFEALIQEDGTIDFGGNTPAQEMLDKGIAVVYCTDETLEMGERHFVKEYPDGRQVIIKVDKDLTEHVIRVIREARDV
jgi:hypothetical protein